MFTFKTIWYSDIILGLKFKKKVKGKKHAFLKIQDGRRPPY